MLKHQRAGRFFGTRLEVLEDKLKNTAKKNISILHKKKQTVLGIPLKAVETSGMI